MKKILLVSRCAWTLYNFRAGLMRTLKRDGYIVLGGGAADDGFVDRIERLGVPFVPLPIDKKAINPGADIRLFWTLYRWYRAEQPDVVHHFTIKPVIYGSIAARLAGVPRIVNTVTGLGFVFTEHHLAWLRRVVELLYRAALASAHYTFFLNKDDLRVFLTRRLVESGKAGLLPGEGVDCESFFPHPNTWRSSGKRVTFLMVARLLREKGVYEYVEAARLVKQEFREVEFNLLGKRDERNPTVVPQADLDCWQEQGIVTWLGEVADVRPIVAQADIVVLPSYYPEGIPRSLLEAAAMGKPLITTDAVGCREVVVDGVNGFRVPVKDSRALAEAMIRLVEHPELRELMGKEGRAKVEREFDERVVIQKVLDIYEGGH
jgi:glycosyltransferase involved in cell wall biosynthesis